LLAALEILQGLPPEERLEWSHALKERFCTYCGRDHPSEHECYCMKDD
jgi:hypothetical protein